MGLESQPSSNPQGHRQLPLFHSESGQVRLCLIPRTNYRFLGWLGWEDPAGLSHQIKGSGNEGRVRSHKILISVGLVLAYSQGSCGYLLNASLEVRRKGAKVVPGGPQLFQAVIPMKSSHELCSSLLSVPFVLGRELPLLFRYPNSPATSSLALPTLHTTGSSAKLCEEVEILSIASI